MKKNREKISLSILFVFYIAFFMWLFIARNPYNTETLTGTLEEVDYENSKYTLLRLKIDNSYYEVERYNESSIFINDFLDEVIVGTAITIEYNTFSKYIVNITSNDKLYLDITKVENDYNILLSIFICLGVALGIGGYFILKKTKSFTTNYLSIKDIDLDIDYSKTLNDSKLFDMHVPSHLKDYVELINFESNYLTMRLKNHNRDLYDISFYGNLNKKNEITDLDDNLLINVINKTTKEKVLLFDSRMHGYFGLFGTEELKNKDFSNINTLNIDAQRIYITIEVISNEDALEMFEYDKDEMVIDEEEPDFKMSKTEILKEAFSYIYIVYENEDGKIIPITEYYSL